MQALSSSPSVGAPLHEFFFPGLIIITDLIIFLFLMLVLLLMMFFFLVQSLLQTHPQTLILFVIGQKGVTYLQHALAFAFFFCMLSHFPLHCLPLRCCCVSQISTRYLNGFVSKPTWKLLWKKSLTSFTFVVNQFDKIYGMWCLSTFLRIVHSTIDNIFVIFYPFFNSPFVQFF